MHAETLRINVALSKDLIESVTRLAGPRGRSRLIEESLREYMRQKEKAALENQLEEGYRAAAKEASEMAGEFEAADLEGWDEY